MNTDEHPEYLAEHIHTAVATGGARQLGVSVAVEPGLVRVSGSVDTPECRRTVIDQVTALAGGRQVVDDLECPLEETPDAAERIR